MIKINTDALLNLVNEENIHNRISNDFENKLIHDNIHKILEDGSIESKKELLKFCNIMGIAPSEITDEIIQVPFKEREAGDDFIEVHNQQIKPFQPYNVLEIFAGAGGLLLGLEEAGFNTIGAVEIVKHACSTLRKNRPDLNVIEGDISKIVDEGIEKFIGNQKVDVISGGFPCQAFSFAGKKLGLRDTRGTLFYYYAALVDQLKPKMFIAENVRGLVSHDKGKTLQGIMDVFDDLGYHVTYKVLKATDYNVAQKRERIFIIGVKRSWSHGFKFPAPLEYKPVLRDVLQNVPPSPGKTYPPRKKEIMEMVPPGGYWRDLPIEIQKEYMKGSFYLGGGKTGMARRISWDEPSLTLTTAPDMKQTERCHPDETRPFTVREYARIQSFPDTWDFEGPVTAQYKQIGNAVPVELARMVGLAVIDKLNNPQNHAEVDLDLNLQQMTLFTN